MKISGIYKITNTVTGEIYIGSSKNVMDRWIKHKSPSTWKNRPGMLLYQAFQQYGLENFTFEIVEETDDLKNREQYFINLLKPTYNANRAFGFDLDRRKSYMKEYKKTYRNQLCEYNGKMLTLHALTMRFWKNNVPNALAEARKYLIARI